MSQIAFWNEYWPKHVHNSRAGVAEAAYIDFKCVFIYKIVLYFPGVHWLAESSEQEVFMSLKLMTFCFYLLDLFETSR